MAAAAAASDQAVTALAELAEALGAPDPQDTVTEALVLAEEGLEVAEAARDALEEALVAAVAAAAPAPGPVARGMYKALEAAATARRSRLEQELRRNRCLHRGLRMGRAAALTLMVFCGILLSLDAVRELLGMTQENHFVTCLATIAIMCQAALLGLATSQRHLAAAASLQDQQAKRFLRLARATTPEGTGEATAAASAALGLLQEVSGHLRSLVAAVKQDLEVAGGRFPASTNALGDTVMALGTTVGDKEGMQRLARALEALPRDE